MPTNKPNPKLQIARSRKLPPKIKKLIKHLVGPNTRYKGVRVYGLEFPKEYEVKFKGVLLGADWQGFFIYTHRARSKSRSTLNAFKKQEIYSIEQTG